MTKRRQFELVISYRASAHSEDAGEKKRENCFAKPISIVAGIATIIGFLVDLVSRIYHLTY